MFRKQIVSPRVNSLHFFQIELSLGGNDEISCRYFLSPNINERPLILFFLFISLAKSSLSGYQYSFDKIYRINGNFVTQIVFRITHIKRVVVCMHFNDGRIFSLMKKFPHRFSLSHSFSFLFLLCIFLLLLLNSFHLKCAFGR